MRWGSTLFNWCSTCKQNDEVIHLFLTHCHAACSLWSFIFHLWGCIGFSFFSKEYRVSWQTVLQNREGGKCEEQPLWAYFKGFRGKEIAYFFLRHGTFVVETERYLSRVFVCLVEGIFREGEVWGPWHCLCCSFSGSFVCLYISVH